MSKAAVSRGRADADTVCVLRLILRMHNAEDTHCEAVVVNRRITVQLDGICMAGDRAPQAVCIRHTKVLRLPPRMVEYWRLFYDWFTGVHRRPLRERMYWEHVRFGCQYVRREIKCLGWRE